ncbi:unnamed protein product [Parascedosporium putredinis]|uniref:Monooxygenase n=1 Tax=Parascedosporium putredinis TaxID=1442378 RepID=A0A9P1GYV2_9PEZI|nr:unnamed protein product [Parascedosporium putredinis]CAI7990272.1 unnamed protein product [Parascedosporium putredinis]
MTSPTKVNHDVVIVGAGLSGINTAYRLQTDLPGKSYTILEGRDNLGGTWDLFRYPGIRSDSDLYSFGFSWRPWESKEPIAKAEAILEYLEESAKEAGIDKHIQYGRRVTEANWNSDQALWHLTVVSGAGGKTVPAETITCRWIILGTGYYNYEEALPADIPGIDKFQGTLIHPQFWPEDLDYADKNIVIIGSGATAVTLLPALAEKAAHVTMLQRTPSYRHFWRRAALAAPGRLAASLVRLKFITVAMLLFKLSRQFPGVVRRYLLGQTEKQLPPNIPVDPHFTPPYNPWEQRLCTCPAGDFYKALSDGRGGVVTGHIEAVDEGSIRVKKHDDGDEILRPDIIITATGLKIQIAGGIRFSVDGDPFNPSEHFIWRGVMLQNLPNLAYIIGYTNASWTLGADVNATIIARIIKNMDAKGARAVLPVTEADMPRQPLLNLNSTYIHRASTVLPATGDRGPWKPRNDYMVDFWASKFASIETDLMYI